MKLHKEGNATITISLVTFAVLGALLWNYAPVYLAYALIAVFTVVFAIIVYFFRLPNRQINTDPAAILAPADGTIVAIEQVTENEYFNDQRMLVSIFMSPLNVHVNLYPVSGEVSYFKYHPGKFLVASLPKSATENERTSCAIRTTGGKELLLRQVAGALARRIVWYAKEGAPAQQGHELGFIKFGSRVDLYLPMDAKIDVQLGQKVFGKITKIARW